MPEIRYFKHIDTVEGRKIEPRKLDVGDWIVTSLFEDGYIKKAERVDRVENYACGKRNTHVNGHACYDWSAPVEILL